MHKTSKLVQLDIYDINDNLVPPWKMWDVLRPGTVILANCSLHCFIMKDKFKDQKVPFHLTTSLQLCWPYISQLYQINAHSICVLAESIEPVLPPIHPSVPLPNTVINKTSTSSQATSTSTQATSAFTAFTAPKRCHEPSPPTNTPNTTTANPNKKTKAPKKEPVPTKLSHTKGKEKDSTSDAMEVEEWITNRFSNPSKIPTKFYVSLVIFNSSHIITFISLHHNDNNKNVAGLAASARFICYCRCAKKSIP